MHSSGVEQPRFGKGYSGVGDATLCSFADADLEALSMRVQPHDRYIRETHLRHGHKARHGRRSLSRRRRSDCGISSTETVRRKLWNILRRFVLRTTLRHLIVEDLSSRERSPRCPTVFTVPQFREGLKTRTAPRKQSSKQEH
eukprot:scaffold1435_cov267-Pinguiococcus_pyrenoidosus.AAC.48